MSKIDQKNYLKTLPFSYRITKDQKLLISHEGKNVMVIKASKSTKTIHKLQAESDYFEIQLLLAKLTGNFKRGNEKDNKS